MTSRPITTGDYERLATMLREDEAHLFGREARLTVNDLREWLSRTDLEHDSWLYEQDGELAAAGWTDAAPGSDAAFGIGVVHPRWKGRGIGAELLRRSETRARENGAARMHQVAFGSDRAAAALIAANGYAEVRRFYEMAIALQERPELSDVPVEPFREEEARAFHAALDEAFQDHWEHHGDGFETWWDRHSSNPNFDPSLWFVVRDGDEIAAVARNEANRNGGGYVGALGVRRPWRGKGYAKALLLRSFREFYDRGMPRVTLGVDADSPTGATHLYERVGMHVEMENVIYEKHLR